MKSLLSNSSKDSIKEKLNYFEPFVSAAKKAAELEENSFLDITGIKGCLNSYFIREYFKFNSAKWLNQLKYNAAGYSSKALQGAGSQEFTSGAGDLVIIVPGEREATALKIDLEVIFPEAKCTVIPGWGTLYYRTVSPGSIIF